MNAPQAPDPLAGLRGYHLPDPVSWWPPAPGWWALALVLLIALGLLARWGIRRYQRDAARRAALAELAALEAAYSKDRDSATLARGLSRLLRRLALHHFPRAQVAGLTGEDWLAFLDAQWDRQGFQQGPGRFLLEAPYRPAPELPAEALIALSRAWIQQLRKVRP